jgi:ubiquinone/menaquinone biosynthesis C-methylase UbiE
MPSDDRRLEKARALLPHCISTPGGVWADLGCGDGIFTTVIQDLIGPDGRVIGVDADARALHRLRERFVRDHPGISVDAITADLRAPIVLPALDGVVFANVLHFMNPEECRDTFRKLVGFVRTGGRAVVVEYNTHSPNAAVPHPLGPESFLMLAANAGLSDGHVVARVSSSFLGEMYAGVALRTAD